MAKDFILNKKTKVESNSKMSVEEHYSSAEVKNYINQRREKAVQQAENEKKKISKPKPVEQKWDETKSFKYAIF